MTFGFGINYIALWCLVIFLTLVSIGLLHQINELRPLLKEVGTSAAPHLPLGSPAPRFSGVDLRSGQGVKSEILRDRFGALLFLSPGCSACRRLAGKIRGSPNDYNVSILAVCEGEKDECRMFLESLNREVPLIIDPDRNIMMLYGISGFPTLVVVDAENKIRGYGKVSGILDFKELLKDALQDPAHKSSAAVES